MPLFRNHASPFRSHLALLGIVLSGLSGDGAAVRAAPETPAAETADKTSPEVERLHELYRADAKTYEFAADQQGSERLVMSPQPIMHWASPDDWSGDIFVWSRAGRPEVVGCILAGPNRLGTRPFFHEFHALSTTPPPVRTFPNGNAWKLAEPPVMWQPVPKAVPPYTSARPWLSQMREIAREFSFGTIFQGGTWELRLLPQPIHRYRNPVLAQRAENKDATRSDWHEGALFAFVQSTGTDAEALLMIEARDTPEGVRWHYAPVRMTNNPLWLKRGGEELWRVAAHTDPAGDKVLPYTTFYAGSKQILAKPLPVQLKPAQPAP